MSASSAGGAYKLSGAGREFISWLLCLRNPALLCVWNANAERMLRRAGAYPRRHEAGASGHPLPGPAGSPGPPGRARPACRTS